MSVIKKGVRKIRLYAVTIVSKIKWRGLYVDGFFGKRHDTQIIISDNGRIKLGKNVLFQKNVALTSVGGILSVGKNVSFNRNCIIICRKEILIGDDVIFGPGVTIYDHDHVFSDKGIQPGFNHGPVVIDNGTWIAANVTILRNTHIGEGCVIGAGAVVKGDIPPHSLVTSERKLSITPIDNR